MSASRLAPVGTADAVRARVPEVLRAWRDARQKVIDTGGVDEELKDLCARYFAGDPELAAGGEAAGLDERQRAALGWAEAIAINPELADDELWRRLHEQFSEPELVELGYCMALLRGQIQWLRTLGLPPEPGRALRV
jgi:hypothetical protein